MAVFGAGNPANATIAFSLLGDNAIAAGYTAPASALGEMGLLAACVASMLGDSMPATQLTVGSGGTQLTKVVVYSLTIPAAGSTCSASVFTEASITATGVVTNDKIFIVPTIAQSSNAIILAHGRVSVTDQIIFTVLAANTTGAVVSAVYRAVAIRS